MKRKLRKMLGSWDAECTQSLVKLIDTQSKRTICRWCIDYAEFAILPIFEERCPGDGRPRMALNAANRYLEGKVRFQEVKDIILNECHAAARELEGDPAAQAAARAIGQASASVHTLSHSVALYFYGAAAVAYSTLGCDAGADEYERMAEEECARMEAALRSVAVPDEKDPAKIKWGC
ncbi:MAG: hypothetical protein LBE48_06025 [Methanomassiliicoccaceae archaeon]|jgi:hypothetical protein|nr:hypothetical protein [Methanomassiliicoccaceae archaeon]